MDERRRKLTFRAWRRGFKEMDLLMGTFADKYIEDMSDAELEAFNEMARHGFQKTWKFGTGPMGKGKAAAAQRFHPV